MAKRTKSIADVANQYQRMNAQYGDANGNSKSAQRQRNINRRIRQAEEITRRYLQNMGANNFVSEDIDKQQSYSRRAGIKG